MAEFRHIHSAHLHVGASCFTFKIFSDTTFQTTLVNLMAFPARLMAVVGWSAVAPTPLLPRWLTLNRIWSLFRLPAVTTSKMKSAKKAESQPIIKLLPSLFLALQLQTQIMRFLWLFVLVSFLWIFAAIISGFAIVATCVFIFLCPRFRPRSVWILSTHNDVKMTAFNS